MGTEGNIAKDGDDFISERCGADSRSDDNIHALLRVVIDLVENGKQLSSASILRQFSEYSEQGEGKRLYVLGTGESENLDREC